MYNYNTSYVVEEKDQIGEIPYLRFRPREYDGRLASIIFYHGWSSSKESQRLVSFTLASLGYQVIVPDSVNHGDRGIIDYLDPVVGVKYFWPTVLKNLNEFEILKNHIIEDLDGDKDRIGVTGHSMGGFTTGGIFTIHQDVKAGVVLNGSCNWEGFNNPILGIIDMDSNEDVQEMIQVLKKFDPINNLDRIKDRPLLLTHGRADAVVSIRPQNKFYDELEPLYTYKDRLKFVKYDNLNHYVTKEMIEELIKWFDKFL